MALSGQQNINIGLPNESTGSDSLYAAFNKAQNNFTNLFALSSSFTSFTGNTGIQVAYGNSNTVVNILNTGVTSLTAGDDSITLTSSNGNVVITASSGGNGGGVSNVNVIGASSNARITSTGGPIISSGVITIDLANSGALAGTYSYPTMTVDQYGRVTSIANAASVGTVTSVGVVTSGLGIQISGGPITSAGNITVINTGVTRLSAGTGINLSSSNGNVTISAATSGGTVTSVGVSSSSLVVSGSPVTTTGTMTVELPANVNVTGTLLLSSSENLASGAAANLSVTASYFTTSTASTATLAAGTTGQIKTFMMVADGGDMVITVSNAGWKSSGTGTITFNDIGDGCTLQYINSKWFCVGQNGVVFG
jgi:hypothetical protein